MSTVNLNITKLQVKNSESVPSSATLLPGELAVGGDHLYFGKRGADSTAAATPTKLVNESDLLNCPTFEDMSNYVNRDEYNTRVKQVNSLFTTTQGNYNTVNKKCDANKSSIDTLTKALTVENQTLDYVKETTISNTKNITIINTSIDTLKETSKTVLLNKNSEVAILDSDLVLEIGSFTLGKEIAYDAYYFYLMEDKSNTDYRVFKMIHQDDYQENIEEAELSLKFSVPLSFSDSKIAQGVYIGTTFLPLDYLKTIFNNKMVSCPCYNSYNANTNYKYWYYIFEITSWDYETLDNGELQLNIGFQGYLGISTKLSSTDSITLDMKARSCELPVRFE